MKSDFQGGPPDDHHFLLKVPKVTVGIFISSSPGTSRAGGNPNSLSINLLHAVLFPYLLIPPSLLTDKNLLHGREMSTALSCSPRQGGLRGPGGTGVQPDERGEPENS